MHFYFLFEQYKLESTEVIKEINTTYFLIEGTYSTKEQASLATKEIKTNLIVKEDANYTVYLAITKDKDNLEKLQNLYKDLNINTTLKKMSIEDQEFIATLEQMDILLTKAEDKEEIEAVNKVVLATYQELIVE